MASPRPDSYRPAAVSSLYFSHGEGSPGAQTDAPRTMATGASAVSPSSP